VAICEERSEVEGLGKRWGFFEKISVDVAMKLTKKI
jgi:hypothetical protein